MGGGIDLMLMAGSQQTQKSHQLSPEDLLVDTFKPMKGSLDIFCASEHMADPFNLQDKLEVPTLKYIVIQINVMQVCNIFRHCTLTNIARCRLKNL